MSYAIEIQNKIMADYEEPNNVAMSRIAKLTLASVFPHGQAELNGPYTKHTTYFYPHGEAVTVVSRSKIDWEFFEVIKS